MFANKETLTHTVFTLWFYSPVLFTVQMENPGKSWKVAHGACDRVQGVMCRHEVF